MKNISIKLLLLTIIINFSSCKKQKSSFADYQFNNEVQVINCGDLDNELLNEALYSFEKDFVPFYDLLQQNPIRAYNTFTKQATGKKIDPTLFASKHSVALANALKESGFITGKGVNYNNPLIKCIAENMKKEGIKTTFNALVATNSFSKQLFNPALQTKTHKVNGDKYLSLYVALEYFYVEILKTDFTNVDFNRPKATKQENTKPIFNPNANNSKVDFNKRPVKQ
ncbi:hypothetical protein Q4512_14520 [Oceanihabitans sp. 2_MG-2023]|uniref:hypothetical protein n=1 Tax=Oceanihabitans sp. 2_MG-2023 TaxID=3062661 RepID=UPI0026E1396F|nr:hypothetical protein [Oceanihabitans sp. 2_MG-2023]MDO6598135.1 hypothetical protein [Oceanihabitans sp. 2_MG-2023]